MLTNRQEDLQQKFNRLFRDGKLVQIHVSQWGMLQTLTSQDLKLDKDFKLEEAVPSFASLGTKKLMPDEVRLKFKRVEAKARSFLSLNSHKFPVADAHFVPAKKLPEVIVQLDKFKTEFTTATTEFFRDYETNKQKMLDAYPNHKSSLEPYFPPASALANKFSFAISVYQVGIPSELKQVNLQEIQAENLAVQELKGKYETLMKDQVAQATAQMHEFVKESNVALRQRVVDVFQTIANKINNREVVTGTNIKSLKSVIDDFDGMDFFDDVDVKAKLAEVKILVKGCGDFRDNHTAITTLQTAVDEVLVAASKVSDIDKITGQYFRRIDI